jgi:hypothetical protein
MYTLGVYLAWHAGELGQRVNILPYSILERIKSFGPGAFIFTDFDRLSGQRRRALVPFVDALTGNGCTVLNHPTKSLMRFELLRKLHEEGVNDFNVHRFSNWREVDRFPVFIRRAGDHEMPVTKLLENKTMLEEAANGIIAQAPFPDDLIIVEFGNVAMEDGKFRKYSAFRVAGEIYGQHCISSANWWIKYGSMDVSEEERLRAYEENKAYIEQNPHGDQLMPAFEAAAIDYGRIDYCMVDGRVQIFEINTNPTVIARHAPPAPEVYAKLHGDALSALLDASGGKATANPLFATGQSSVEPALMSQRFLAMESQIWRPPGGKTRLEMEDA